jgi:molybdopterin synthase catalytic subunit
MQIDVTLFATLKDRAGTNRVTVTVPDEAASVRDLVAALADAYPALAEHLPHALVSVEQEFAFPDDPLPPGAEVAIFPPVSGGSPPPDYFAVTADPLDLNAIVTAITRPDTGGVAVFHGSVRGETEKEGLPPQTEHLVYEAYEPMAEKKMAQIAEEIRHKWPAVVGVAIVQRIGRLDVGETTTFVAVSAGHRTDGIFDAARYGIDRLKQIVPVWKKEFGPDGAEWVEGDYQPTPDDTQRED